jgi:hypothetical protein
MVYTTGELAKILDAHPNDVAQMGSRGWIESVGRKGDRPNSSRLWDETARRRAEIFLKMATLPARYPLTAALLSNGGEYENEFIHIKLKVEV